MYISSDNVLKKVSALDIHEGILNIPTGTVSIAADAITGLKDLRTIVFPESLKTIEGKSITNTGIIHLIIPETVKRIEQHAFDENPNLAIVEVNNPDTEFDGTCVYGCTSLMYFKVGAIKYNVRCLKYGACYQILSKKMVDIYTVYYVEPFKRSANIGKLFIAIKQGVAGDGVSIERAIEDCHNNYMTPDIVQQYKDITLDTLIGWYDYKRITGACDEGIIKWMKEEGFQENDKLPARELIKRLKNAFGSSTFAQFIADRYADRAKEAEHGRKN